MASPRWCAYMQAQLEKDEREKERAQWEAEHTSSEWCPKCGRVLYIREGKYGEFLGCSGYPDCTFTKKYGNDISNDRVSSNRTAKREVKSSPVRKKEAECMPGRKPRAEDADKKVYLEKRYHAQELVREYTACVETAKNTCISQFRNDNQKRMEELRQSIATLENTRKSIYSIHFRKRAALQEQIANQQTLLTQISSDEYQKSRIQNIEKRARAIFEQYQSDMDDYMKRLFPYIGVFQVEYGAEIVACLEHMGTRLMIEEMTQYSGELYGYSTYKLSPSVRELVNRGILVRIEEKGKAYFDLAIKHPQTTHHYVSIQNDYTQHPDWADMGFPTPPDIKKFLTVIDSEGIRQENIVKHQDEFSMNNNNDNDKYMIRRVLAVIILIAVIALAIWLIATMGFSGFLMLLIIIFLGVCVLRWIYS